MGDQAAEYLAEVGLGVPIFFGGSMTEKEDLNSQAGCIGLWFETSFNVAFNAEIGDFFAQEGGWGVAFDW